MVAAHCLERGRLEVAQTICERILDEIAVLIQLNRAARRPQTRAGGQ
jgi:hypothetical protein